MSPELPTSRRSPWCECARECQLAVHRIKLVVVHVQADDGFPERHDEHIVTRLKFITDLVAPLGIECVVEKMNGIDTFDPLREPGHKLCRVMPNRDGRRQLNASNFLTRMTAQLHAQGAIDSNVNVDNSQDDVHTIYIVACDLYATQPHHVACIDQYSRESSSVWTALRSTEPLDVDPVIGAVSSLLHLVCTKTLKFVKNCASPDCFATAHSLYPCSCCMKRLTTDGVDTRVALQEIRSVLMRHTHDSADITRIDARLADLQRASEPQEPNEKSVDLIVPLVDPTEPRHHEDGTEEEAEDDQGTENMHGSEDDQDTDIDERICETQEELVEAQKKLMRKKLIESHQEMIRHQDETILRLQDEIVALKNKTIPTSFADHWMKRADARTELKVCGVTFTPTMCYRATVDLDPSCHRAWFKLGQAGGDDTYSAIECFEKAAELVPENYVYNCSLVLHGGATVRGCSTSAPQCILKALRLVPSSDASLIKFRIDCWLKLGSLGGCGPHTRTQCYEEVLKLDADNADAWAQLAHLEGCDFGGAQYPPVDCCDRALTIDVRRPSVWHRLAELGGGLVGGVYHEPRTCWRLSLVESTEDPTPKQLSERWFGLSETCGDPKERKACVERALDVDQSGDGDSGYWWALYECGGGTARGKVWTFWQCLDLAVKCYPRQERYRKTQWTLLQEFARDDRVMKIGLELREVSRADDSSDDELDIQPVTKRLRTESASLVAGQAD